jgi:hypothetical protein
VGEGRMESYCLTGEASVRNDEKVLEIAVMVAQNVHVLNALNYMGKMEKS